MLEMGPSVLLRNTALKSLRCSVIIVFSTLVQDVLTKIPANFRRKKWNVNDPLYPNVTNTSGAVSFTIHQLHNLWAWPGGGACSLITDHAYWLFCREAAPGGLQGAHSHQGGPQHWRKRHCQILCEGQAVLRHGGAQALGTCGPKAGVITLHPLHGKPQNTPPTPPPLRASIQKPTLPISTSSSQSFLHHCPPPGISAGHRQRCDDMKPFLTFWKSIPIYREMGGCIAHQPTIQFHPTWTCAL